MPNKQNQNIYRGRTESGFFRFDLNGHAAIGFGYLSKLEMDETGDEREISHLKSRLRPDMNSKDNVEIRLIGNRTNAVLRFKGTVEYLVRNFNKQIKSISSKSSNKDEADKYENEIMKLRIGREQGVPMRMRMDLIVRMTGESKSNIYKKIAKGTFPPKQVSKDKGSFWLAEDVFRYMEGNYEGRLNKTH